jgi:1-acyl-sn-glycerol-3-phosphate acyltransferase
VRESVLEETAQDPLQRDPASVEKFAPVVRALARYFDWEVRGWENVPDAEPVLFVANHSGGTSTVDPFPLLDKWIEERGFDAPLYALTYDLIFGVPGLGPMLRQLGSIPASHDNAERALDKGASVLVFPGGDYEVFRPWRERNQIDFGGRMGFIELAIRAGVKVIPVTIHGAHESTFVLTRGTQLAARIGLDSLKVKVLPIVWSPLTGVAPAVLPTMPLPSKITMELGEPLDWTSHDEAAAEDPVRLQACYDEIIEVMQRAMDRMAEENPWPVLSRLGKLANLFRWA